jgi:putative ABC transport system permease protein
MTPDRRPARERPRGRARSAQTSLRIFDRSFAVTYWLQAGGDWRSGCSAWRPAFRRQVLARRKEFGLLQPPGLHAPQSGAGAWWPAKGPRLDQRVGTLLGLGLGLAVSGGAGACGQPAELPLDHGPVCCRWLRLSALCAGGDGRPARLTALDLRPHGREPADGVLAVKEDW